MGYEGILVARTGAARVRVLLTVMGQPARMSLDAGAVEPAEGDGQPDSPSGVDGRLTTRR